MSACRDSASRAKQATPCLSHDVSGAHGDPLSHNVSGAHGDPLSHDVSGAHSNPLLYDDAYAARLVALAELGVSPVQGPRQALGDHPRLAVSPEPPTVPRWAIPPGSLSEGAGRREHLRQASAVVDLDHDAGLLEALNRSVVPSVVRLIRSDR